MKLKIYSDRSYCSQNLSHVPMLFPFWEKTAEKSEDFRSGSYDRYIKTGRSLFELTSLEEADLAVLPVYWHLTKNSQLARDSALQFIQQANRAGKQVVIFSIGDWNEALAAENITIFYTSSFRSRRKLNEFAIPEWSQDFIETDFDNCINIRQKSAKPKIGFCGYAPPLGLRFGTKKLKALLRLGVDRVGITNLLSYRTGHTTRVRALQALSKSSLVETNFLLRDFFAFASQGKSLQTIQSDRLDFARKSRQEYQQNMMASDYILCASGYENYSLRFYETLSCGRIPIFIDTDCVLPYDFAINWKKYCVWVEENELHLIAEKVADFHARLSPQDFIDLQYECRKIWQDWISPEGFFRNFNYHFSHKILPFCDRASVLNARDS